MFHLSKNDVHNYINIHYFSQTILDVARQGSFRDRPGTHTADYTSDDGLAFCINCEVSIATMWVLYSIKIFEVENFHRFHWSERSCENFLLQNFTHLFPQYTCRNSNSGTNKPCAHYWTVSIPFFLIIMLYRHIHVHNAFISFLLTAFSVSDCDPWPHQALQVVQWLL